jgi:hypothetical protein
MIEYICTEVYNIVVYIMFILFYCTPHRTNWFAPIQTVKAFILLTREIMWIGKNMLSLSMESRYATAF